MYYSDDRPSFTNRMNGIIIKEVEYIYNKNARKIILLHVVHMYVECTHHTTFSF